MSFSASLAELVERSEAPLTAAAHSWPRVQLGQVITLLNGAPWKSEYFNDKHGAPLIRIRDVTTGATSTYYSGPIDNNYWIEPGDILIGMDGDFNLRVWTSPRGLLNQRVCKITADERFLLPGYLAHVLPGYLKLINDETHSVTVKHLSSKTICEIPIPLPSLQEQRRIVAKLDSLRARSARARQELDHVPKLIERYKQGILAKAFSGELTSDWRARHISTNAAAFVAERQRQIAMIAVELGRGRDEKTALLATDADLRAQLPAIAIEHPLPDEWIWAGLGQVFGIYVGATPSRKEPRYWGGDINWVSSGEVAFCRISSTAEHITAEGLDNASTRVHPTGSVLLGMIGEGKTRGQAAILDIPACNNQNCAAIRVSEPGYPPEYVYWYLYLAYEETRTSGAGNNQPALNKDRVQRLPIPLAPVEEAFEIARAIEVAFAWLDKIAMEHDRAEHLLPKLDQAILAKAFCGELVPQDPNDEPASLLLERIAAKNEVTTAPRGKARSA